MAYSPTPEECLASTRTTSETHTRTYDSEFLAQFDTSNPEPYTGTCEIPLQTGERPWWHKSGYDPYDCGNRIIALNWTTYCCYGKVIDLTQPLESENHRFSNELCLENMRCCPEDPDVDTGDATSCTVGTEVSLLMESSVSTAYWTTACASYPAYEDDLFPSITSRASSATATSTPNVAYNQSPTFSLLGTLLLLAAFLH